MNRKLYLTGGAILAFVLAACQTQTVTVTQEVTREVPVTVVVTQPGGAPAATSAAPAATSAAPAATSAAPASTTAPGAVEYTLGEVLPYTGDLGKYGLGFKEGVDLAVEQMNAQLAAAGRPITFKTVSQDTTGTPDGAAKAFQTVVQSSGAQVVIGPLSTAEVLGAKQYADQNHVVIVAPASTGMAGAIPNDFIFRLFDPPDAFAGQAFVGIAAARGYTNVVILNVDDPFGNGMVQVFSDGFKAAGGGEISAVKYDPNATDLSSEVTKVSAEIARLSATGKTAFFCACYLGAAQKVLQLAVTDANMGKVDWLGVENLRDSAMLQDKAQAQLLASTHFTAVSFIGTQNPNTKPFVDAYTQKYGHAPGPFTNYAYDAANVAMLTILVAGNNGVAVQKALPFVADHYIGTEVQAYLDANGDQAIASYGIYQVKPDGSDFALIGTYTSTTGKVTFNQ
jgi:branched-chain amino acid transport system substrate-binding protein